MIAAYIFAALTFAVLLAGIRVLHLANRELGDAIRVLRDVPRAPFTGVYSLQFPPGTEVEDLVAPRIAELNRTLELLGEWRKAAEDELLEHLVRIPDPADRLAVARRARKVESLRHYLRSLTDLAKQIGWIIAAQAALVNLDAAKKEI